MPITAADTRTNSALDFLLQTENKNLKEFNSVWFPEKWNISKNGTTPYFCKYLLFSGDYEVDWRRDKKNKKKGQKKTSVTTVYYGGPIFIVMEQIRHGREV